jgi:hypothetical protein
MVVEVGYVVSPLPEQIFLYRGTALDTISNVTQSAQYKGKTWGAV